MAERLRPSTPLALARRLLADQRVRFLIIGGVNTVVGYLWFVVFQLTVGVAWGYMATLVFSHVASVICAFLLQRHFVFKVKGGWWLDLARFELVQLVSFGVNLIALPVLVEIVKLAPLIAQAIILAVTVVFSYFAHRSFSFRRRGSATSHETGLPGSVHDPDDGM